MMRRILGLGYVALIACAGAASAQPLNNTDQKCVNAMNKDTSQIQAARGKLDAACVKDVEKGKIAGTAEACITADAHQKVLKAVTKIGVDNGKHCPDSPAFAYTSPGTASSAATTAEENLLHDMFGNPADAGLVPCDPSAVECACHLHVQPRVENLLRTLEAEFIRCKVAVLAPGKTAAFMLGAASAADVGRCITDGTITQSVEADPKQAFQKAFTLLQSADSKFCTLGNEFNTGACTGLADGAPLDDCFKQHAKCRFCQMANAADGLSVDCTTWSGISCP